MAATAEKVTPIEEGKDLVQFNKALVKFDIQEQVIQDLEEATRLEITDAASEKVIRKHRQNAKTIEVRIEKTRLQLNREFKEKTDAAAALIAPRVTSAYNKLDEKIKVVEAEREARKAEKEEAERLRLGKIQWRMDGLEYDCMAGLGYNIPSGEIQEALDTLRKIEISAVDFEEQTEKAEQMLVAGISATESALEGRKKFEADQAEAARIKEAQEAEAKRLADERAKMEARERELAEAARKKEQEEAEKRQAAERQLAREREKMEADRKALEKEKAEAAHAAVVAEREIFWELAHKQNARFDYLRDWDAAIKEDGERRAAYEATEKAKAEAAARAKLVEPDKALVKTVACNLDQAVSGVLTPIANTHEGNTLIRDAIADIKTRIHELEMAGAALR